MSLSDEQHAFALDKILLEIKIKMSPILTKWTLGDAYRSPEEQKRLFDAGYSKTLNSQHAKRLAQDYNFWINGDYMGSLSKDEILKALTPIGEYWQSLSQKNRWGGFWEFFDPMHFERVD